MKLGNAYFKLMFDFTIIYNMMRLEERNLPCTALTFKQVKYLIENARRAGYEECKMGVEL